MNKNPRITTVYDADYRGLDRGTERAVSAARRYSAEAKKARAANDELNRSFRGAAQGASAIDGPLGGIASRITAVNGLLTSNAALWSGLGASVAAASFLVGGAVKEFANVERQQLQLEALLKATGSAAGLTAGEIDGLARSLAEDTLASPEGVRQAISVMLTFRRVSGDAFTQAIRLSQDLASTFGGDIRSSALQLGKALDDPVTGLTALRRAGVSFSDSEKELIQSLYDAGDAAEAQSIILQRLSDQVGGSGRAEGAGLVGKVDLLSQRWGEFLEGLNRTSGASDAAGGFLDSLTLRLQNLSKIVSPGEELQVKRLHDEYVRLGGELERIESKGFRRFGFEGNRVNALRRRREVLAEQISVLQEAEKQRVIARQNAERSARESAEKERERFEAEQEAKHVSIRRQRDSRELAQKQRQDARIISLQQKRFERLQDAALSAEGRDRELSIVRFQRQRQELDSQERLLRERGLLTDSLERQFYEARENAQKAHVERMRLIYESELNDGSARESREVNFTRLLAEQFGIRSRIQQQSGEDRIRSEERQAVETVRFFSEGLSAAASQSKRWFQFQKALQVNEVFQNTRAAAVGAYKSLVGIPYVGPVLAVGAAGAAIEFGRRQVSAITSRQVPSFMGGGFTGSGPRVGGVDNRGGFNAILHPDEFVVDLKKNKSGIAPTIIINNAPPGTQVHYDSARDATIVDLAVERSRQDFVRDMAVRGDMFKSIQSATGVKSVASR